MLRIKILDGAMGTELKRLGYEKEPYLAVLEAPSLVKEIHNSYIQAGSDIIYTNSFGANPSKFSSKESFYDFQEKCISLAKNSKSLVAYSVSPIGMLLNIPGGLTSDSVIEEYKTLFSNLKGVDYVIFETFLDVLELKLAISVLREYSNVKIIASLSYQSNCLTYNGLTPQEVGRILSFMDIQAIGVNCSFGPSEMIKIIDAYNEVVSYPLLIKPNMGLPDEDDCYHLTDTEFLNEMEEIIKKDNVAYIGGCCGTTASTIKELSKFKTVVVKRNKKIINYPFDLFNKKFLVCGDRINTTGNKLLKEALIKEDIKYIRELAVNQISNGADLLDINLSFHQTDESYLVKEVVKDFSVYVNVPLIFDTKSADVFENACKYYRGIPILNSVCLDNNYQELLAVVKKYGGVVIYLMMDEKGLIEESNINFSLKTLDKYGIPKNRTILDFGVMPISIVNNISLLLNKVKNSKRKTILGVSNISHKQPNKDIDSYFLSELINNNLSIALVNPFDIGIQKYLSSYNKLHNIKEHNKNTSESVISLEQAILNKVIVSKEFIKEHLIPLDEVVLFYQQVLTEYDKGLINLAELLIVNDIIINYRTITNSPNYQREIVFGTVFNDIHDIGKNIIISILKSSGYNVIDLGQSVSKERFLKAINTNTLCVCMSGLMTPSIKEMEETIKLIKSNYKDIPCIVGGAVINKKVSKIIGADYYGTGANDIIQILSTIGGNK
jgi:5-methyltetrahydrofolate--homocysteine methyltransferase